MAIDSQILTATIGLLSSVIVAIFGYLFNKKRERDNEIRKEKLGYYKEFISSFNGILNETNSNEGQANFSKSSNNLNLIASIPVIKALQAFQDEIKVSNVNRNLDEHDNKLTNLLYEIRKDLGLKDSDSLGRERLIFRLWAPGYTSKRKRQI